VSGLASTVTSPRTPNLILKVFRPPREDHQSPTVGCPEGEDMRLPITTGAPLFTMRDLGIA